MIGHFGAGVIGEEQAALEAKIAERAEDKFGPGVLDPDKTRPARTAPAAPARTPLDADTITALAQAVENGTVVPTAAVDEPPTGDAAREAYQRAVAAEEEKATEPDFLTLSIADLERELAANPDAFDRLMHLEFRRPEGPRKGACRAFKKAEEAQEQPRREVLDVLAHVLTGAAE